MVGEEDIFGLNFMDNSDEFDFGLGWGNKTATFRWNHLFSDKLFDTKFLTETNVFSKLLFSKLLFSKLFSFDFNILTNCFIFYYSSFFCFSVSQSKLF